MNIWIFNHYATAPSHAGGTRHFDLAKHLGDIGHQVTIFASSFNHFSKKEMVFTSGKSQSHEELIEGVRFVWIKTPPYRHSFGRVRNILSYSIKSYLKAISELRVEKADLVIGSSVHPLAAIVGYFIAKKNKSKFYFEERDLWPQTFVDFGKIAANHPAAVLLYKIEKLLYKKADRIIVLFENAVKYVESKGIDRDKIICLPNGVNLGAGKSTSAIVTNAIDRVLSRMDGKFTVVYTGSHGVANHLEPVIELFFLLKEHPDFHLLMVGEGAKKDSLINKARQNGMTNITFLDPVPKAAIPYLLSKADMGIISIMDSPLYKWGFSMNKLYDYMAARLPILVIANSELAGTLKDQSGIHVSADLKKMARVLQEYKSNPEKRMKAGVDMRRHVERNYSWRILAEQLNAYLAEDAFGKRSEKKYEATL
jgi:glycosyltransferase involved in cell wall biosynthesis